MTYDATDNARKCYELAIKQLRLAGIREGKFKPNMQAADERAAWRQHQISKGMRAWWKRRPQQLDTGAGQ